MPSFQPPAQSASKPHVLLADEAADAAVRRCCGSVSQVSRAMDLQARSQTLRHKSTALAQTSAQAPQHAKYARLLALARADYLEMPGLTPPGAMTSKYTAVSRLTRR